MTKDVMTMACKIKLDLWSHSVLNFIMRVLDVTLSIKPYTDLIKDSKFLRPTHQDIFIGISNLHS